MEIKIFQKTQRDLAATLINVIDTYWEGGVTEKEMIEMIKKLYTNNTSKFIKKGEFTTVLLQQCGKRRLEVVSKVLNLTNNVGT